MPLDYANERFVLLYTRDTATWKLLDWEARAVLMFLLRKVDRSGVIDVGEDGIDGLAAVLEVPVDVVARALPKLIARKTVTESATSFAMPNFLDAQETPRSDKQRQRDSRERRRADAVTNGHAVSRGVTDGHASHGPSRNVTPSQAKPSQPDQPDQEGEARATAAPVAAPALTLESPSTKPRQRKPRPSSPATLAPATDPEPSDRDRAFAAERGVDMAEWSAMFDHHRRRGEPSSDWSASWRTWCRNAVKFAARDAANRRPATGLAATAEILRDRAGSTFIDPFKPRGTS